MGVIKLTAAATGRGPKKLHRFLENYAFQRGLVGTAVKSLGRTTPKHDYSNPAPAPPDLSENRGRPSPATAISAPHSRRARGPLDEP